MWFTSPVNFVRPSVFVFCVHCLVFFVWPHGIELCMPDTSLILCAPLCLNVFLRAQPLWLSREPSLLPRDLSGGCCGHCVAVAAVRLPLRLSGSCGCWGCWGCLLDRSWILLGRSNYSASKGLKL